MPGPEQIIDSVRGLSDDGLHNLAEVVRQVQIERAIDVVSGRARSGQHSVDQVVSCEVRDEDLVEVSQRNVAAAKMR